MVGSDIHEINVRAATGLYLLNLCDLPPSSLKQKIACKVRDEHALVKSMPPPNETIAKMAARNTSLSHGMILL